MPSESETRSLWMKTASRHNYSPITGSSNCDVCVVGAGIAGLTTAYLLLRDGKNVIVIDSRDIAAGESSRTTAHITYALDDRYIKIEQLFGLDGSRLAADSHRAAIDKIEEIVKAEKINCNFERVDGYLFCGPEHDRNILDEELAAVHRAGLTEVERVSGAPLANFNTGIALRFPRQGQFHPLEYLAGLATAIEKRGGRIHGRSKAEGIAEGKVELANGAHITAASIVVTTNVPINDWVAIHAKQAAYRSYVIGVRVPLGSVTRALYWDTSDPYHYVRLASDSQGEMLIVGGEDHKTGQADDADRRYSALEQWTRDHVAAAGEVTDRWSGQIIEPFDAMAFIGRNPGNDPNIFIATGDSGNGITHGTIAGMLLSDLIASRPNPWAKLYDPSRITTKAGLEFMKESINFVAQYGDWLTPGDDVAKIPRGVGAVVRRGLRKIAVYRDLDGSIHQRAATCPHMGCIVGWNSNENTWDCPCHGSRFTSQGKVLNGPATTDLSKPN
jgi:glycine/D-amino acid oxidase-like deaminating enzyme/nitrite reductase/ring-hydroxylating ferredoxin subunit